VTEPQREQIGRLMVRYAPGMVQLAFRKTCDRRLAEELVQETFLTACVKAERVCTCENPGTWLYNVLYKLILRALEQSWRTREIPVEQIETLIAQTDELNVADCLPRGLTREERRLILLRVEYGLSHRELAGWMGLSEAACRKRLSRAVRRCRLLLEQEEATERRKRHADPISK